jgi:hypothetical protein
MGDLAYNVGSNGRFRLCSSVGSNGRPRLQYGPASLLVGSSLVYSYTSKINGDVTCDFASAFLLAQVGDLATAELYQAKLAEVIWRRRRIIAQGEARRSGARQKKICQGECRHSLGRQWRIRLQWRQCLGR